MSDIEGKEILFKNIKVLIDNYTNDYEIYKRLYDQILELPIVKNLQKENQILKEIIFSLRSGSDETENIKIEIIEKDLSDDTKHVEIGQTKITQYIPTLTSDSAYTTTRNIRIVENENEEEEEEEDDEFACDVCSNSEPHNYCFKCEEEDICSSCNGNGGDYGENDKWVCEKCLDDNEEQNTISEVSKCVVGALLVQKNVDVIDDGSSEEDEEEEEEEEINKCDECDIELNKERDGSMDENVGCKNCHWEDKEGKRSNNIINPDCRGNGEEEDRYVDCDNCDVRIDCWNNNIYCLYKGDQKCRKEEITVCQNCNDELIEEFKEEGYNCDDWDKDEEYEEVKKRINCDKEREPWDEEEEEEEIEVEEEEEEEEEEEIEVEEEEEEEAFEVEIKGKTYYTTDKQNGIIYNMTNDDDIGEELGYFANGKAVFQ
jgi:hypothetical protein